MLTLTSRFTFCSSNVSMFTCVSFFSLTHMHRPGCYGNLQTRLPAASSLPRSPVSFCIAHRQTFHLSLRWRLLLAEPVLSSIPLFVLRYAPSAFFVWALLTHTRFCAVLSLRAFLVDGLEPIRVGVFTKPVHLHKRGTFIRVFFLRVNMHILWPSSVAPADALRFLPTYLPPSLNAPINRPTQ